MANINARLTGQQLFEYTPHTEVSGDAWSIIKTGTATANGAADGTTLIDTGGDSGGADTYSGRYWVMMLSGSNAGEEKRIVDDDGSGTLTLENNGFPNRVDSGDEYEIRLSPIPVVVIDSSSGETDAVDAVRAEDDDYWVGYYLCPITGSHRGKTAEITSFTSSTGTFVLASSFGSALAAGDVCELKRFVEAGNVSLSLTEDYHARASNRVNFSKGDGVVGARGGTVGFSAQVTASGSLSAAGSVAGRSVLDGLFECVGLEKSAGTSCDVAAGSSTSQVKVDSGQRENLDVGHLVVWNGTPTIVDSLTDNAASPDDVDVSPSLPLAPAENDTLYAATRYGKSLDGDLHGATIVCEYDGMRYTMTGCKGSLSFSAAGVLELSWQLSVDHWIREYEAAPYNPGSAYTAAAAIQDHERIAYADSSKRNISTVTFATGTKVSPVDVMGSTGLNGRNGFQITGYEASMSFSEISEVDSGMDEDVEWRARTAKDFFVYWGTHGDIFAIRLPAARRMALPAQGDNRGQVTLASALDPQDAGTALDGTDTQKIPDFAIFLS